MTTTQTPTVGAYDTVTTPGASELAAPGQPVTASRILDGDVQLVGVEFGGTLAASIRDLITYLREPGNARERAMIVTMLTGPTGLDITRRCDITGRIAAGMSMRGMTTVVLDVEQAYELSEQLAGASYEADRCARCDNFAVGMGYCASHLGDN